MDFNNLELKSEEKGMIEFSTGNYPFGGLERFFMVLKAFDLEPIECFNGFSILELKWTSDFKYSTKELIEETKFYLEK